MTLWITNIPSEPSKLQILLTLRKALRVFDKSADYNGAVALYDAFQDEGQAHLEVPDDDLEAVQAILNDAGIQTTTDDALEAPPSAADEPTLVVNSDAAYSTAMLLMANVEGNPLKAAAVAVGLARTTGEIEFYTAVVATLIGTFPWLEAMMKQQNLLF